MVNTNNTVKNKIKYPPVEINNYINHILYINLDKRTDRKMRIEKQLEVFDKNKVTRIPGVEDPNGPVYSCAMSHIKALEYAKNHKMPQVLILEDDAIWANVSKAYPIFEMLIKQPFDVLMLGGSYPRYDKNTYKLNFAYSASSYICVEAYYDKMIESVKERLKTYNPNVPKNPKVHNIAVNVTYSKLQEVDNWFIVMPALMIQGKSHSNIIGSFVNYTNTFKSKKRNQRNSKKLIGGAFKFKGRTKLIRPE